jgi:hypothetical protein
MKLGIVVGHTDQAEGASMTREYAFISEYEYNTVLAGVIKSLALEGFPAPETEVFLRDSAGTEGAHRAAAAWGANHVVELHFNWADEKSVTGFEVLSIDAHRPTAENLRKEIAAVLRLRDRGVKVVHEGDRGFANVNRSVPTVLLETFFGSNPQDCKYALQNMLPIARAILRAHSETDVK